MNTPIKYHNIFGADLGTFNGVTCIVNDLGNPIPIPGPDGLPFMRSVVHISNDGSEIQHGVEALNYGILEPLNTYQYYKIDVGSDKTYGTAGGKDFTPMLLQAEQLKAMRLNIVEHFGDPNAGSKAVITVPAYFSEKERQSVCESTRLAGIELLGLIGEPVAAAIAYGFNNKQGDRILLVVDWGAGTFDCSLVYMCNGDCKVLATHGDTKLGGRDVNNAVIAKIVTAFDSEHGMTLTREGYPEDWFQLEEEVERQKKQLAARQEVKFAIRIDGKNISFSMSRGELGQLIQPLISRMQAIIDETIERAKIAAEDISNILFVGGSTREPNFQEMIKRNYGEDKIHRGQTSPDLAVAEGAALEALRIAVEDGTKVVDSTTLKAIPTPAIKRSEAMPHSLGVTVADPVTKATSCSVILERDSLIPAAKVESYAAINAEQDKFVIQVLQGEDGQALDDCLVVGESLLTLPPRDPSTHSIDVSMGYDRSGLVTVTVTDRVSNQSTDITVDFYSKQAAKGKS